MTGRGFVICLPGVPRELEYMMEHQVIPLLTERMGGPQVTKVRILRTCAVGESNVDRAIGDLMLSENPTVGLAAHAGQTDVRITAKAETEDGAETLIREMEGKVRERLGVAIYGTEKETVPEVVVRLLKKGNHKVGIVDTLTSGQLGRDLAEAGFADSIVGNFHSASLEDAIGKAGLGKSDKHHEGNPQDLAAALAAWVRPAGGIGLAIVGPFADNSTSIALEGPGDTRLTEAGRNYQDTGFVRRWIVIQALDRIRRALVGQLTSPADWA
jgi:hypothetical protein